MGLLTREQILSADDVKTEVVPVPEWGGEVRVRGLTGLQRDRFEARVVEEDFDNVRAAYAAASIIDEDGNQMFTAEDIDELGNKSASALQRVLLVAQRISGVSENELESMEKNS